jgi:hypothetical protein
MKTMFRTLGIVVVTALFAVSCGASCEDKAADFATATTTYTTAIGDGDCAAAATAIADWKSAWEDLCDESKDQASYDIVVAGYESWASENCE